MAGYGWDEYDVRTGGRQAIHDVENQIDIQTEFVKVPGGDHGGNWAVRIKGTPREDASGNLKSTVVFYTGLEGLGSLIIADDDVTTNESGGVVINGRSVELGEFKIDITRGPSTNVHPAHRHPSYVEKPLDAPIVHSSQVPEEALWQTKPLLFTYMKKAVDDYVERFGSENSPPPWQVFTLPNEPGPGNLHFIQQVFEGPFEFDVIYSSASAPTPLTSETLGKEIDLVTESFSERYSRFLAPEAPFNKPKYERFSKALFSNLIGGIGYFYGDSIVDRSDAPEYEEENEGFWEEAAEARARGNVQPEGPFELFTSIPSRPFFPRGFLWDEGFHLLPVLDWDIDLTLDIIKSWFNLMDEDGWIAREQILGLEARSKVPSEFQVQYPHYANPPTLFLVLESLLDKLLLGPASSGSAAANADQTYISDIHTAHIDNPEAAGQYLKSLYPLLKRHYFWYRKTQWGDIRSYDREAFSSKEGYRWRGRTVQHILTSGIDDYPRAQPPHPGELHVDLISWMGMMTRSLKRIAIVLHEDEDAAEFAGYENAITRNIDDLHWDEKARTYCDATIDDYEENVHVCHKGYVSLFPFLTGMLAPDSAHLGAILDLIADPEELWTDYGIRSLSKKDEFYGTEENYWRSPIWMNMNYLVVLRLLELAQPSPSSSSTPSPHRVRAQRMYSDLRKNLVANVYKQWEKTGFAWEQYNPDSGEGQRTQHFTGWTALVVKIMKMPDLSDNGGGHDEL
ncbi:MAG: Processing alpha glucosidase I [Chaenotheca gracillima]|nr:MAG: Processing alpha glucosidase I [Chaenotheca gracillima]